MKILILGAGQVGSTAATNLAQEEQNEITVVDTNSEVLKELGDRLDIRTVEGFASHPRVLEQAGCADADILVALTNSDETNMVACQVAYTMFHTKTKIARVRDAAYAHASAEKIFSQEALPVDVIISPEQLVTEHIERLIHFPGALQVLEFADGRVRLVGVTAHEGGLLVGQELRALAEHMPNTDARVAAIYRDGESLKPDGDTIIQEGDNVFFIAERNDIRLVMSEMRKLETPVRRVMIAGGGNIGYRLAKVLERTNKVKLIERDKVRGRKISEKLRKTRVLIGDAADQALLEEENIDNTDVFVSVTNSEEANILSAMVAKRLGVKKAIALINRPSYGEVVESGGVIDVAVSPQQITSGALLSHVRRGDVVKVHTLRRGAAEAMEAIAHGDNKSSRVVGKALEDIRLPKGTTIAALVRGEQVIMAHHDVVIQTDDHVILFLTDRKRIPDVEDLFQVNVKVSRK